MQYKEKLLSLLINGVLDSQIKTVGTLFTLFKVGNIMPNNMPFFIGNTPWHKEDCNVASMIDDLRVYDKVIELDFIQAESQLALSGVEPSFITFGCSDCDILTASTSCQLNYHLCTSIELYTGGYQVARILGWVFLLFL